ncbi:hypothetical protein CK501_00915 [Halovibrio salipaludis]|uniref:Uncharacterized protein n=1 Tax=Halovibrio salipaludis TaxID=2032626 RepID=A0A2A2FAI1_9GAMM|nr:hypothetical protein [Halovibrio salipaludis]PAU81744.1 hypothetical protein CK501_00915 [Halovibrio salipaludis]
MTESTRRVSLEQARKLKSLSDSRKFREVSEEEIARMIEEDPDLYHLTDQELAEFELAGMTTDERDRS